MKASGPDVVAAEDPPVWGTQLPNNGPAPDVPGYGPAPADWTKGEAITIANGDKYGCAGVFLDGWIRITCPHIEKAAPFSGYRPTQTSVGFSGDVAFFTTPYVRGTDLSVRFDRKASAPQKLHVRRRFFVSLRWLGKDRPDTPALVNDDEDKPFPENRDF